MTYTSLHRRLSHVRGRARDHACVDCGEGADDWSYDHSCPDELLGIHNGKLLPYTLDLDRYQPRCLSCHRKHDHKIQPCAKPGCKKSVRPPLMYCYRHPVTRPTRGPTAPPSMLGKSWASSPDEPGRLRRQKTTPAVSFTHKKCRECLAEKSVEMFSTRGADAAHRPDPFKSVCLQCDRAMANARYARRKARRNGWGLSQQTFLGAERRGAR